MLKYKKETAWTIKDAISWSVLLTLGDDLWNLEEYLVLVDHHVLGATGDFTTAFCMLFARYFCFHVCYAEGVESTLEFIQRWVFKSFQRDFFPFFLHKKAANVSIVLLMLVSNDLHRGFLVLAVEPASILPIFSSWKPLPVVACCTRSLHTLKQHWKHMIIVSKNPLCLILSKTTFSRKQNTCLLWELIIKGFLLFDSNSLLLWGEVSCDCSSEISAWQWKPSLCDAPARWPVVLAPIALFVCLFELTNTPFLVAELSLKVDQFAVERQLVVPSAFFKLPVIICVP